MLMKTGKEGKEVKINAKNVSKFENQQQSTKVVFGREFPSKKCGEPLS